MRVLHLAPHGEARSGIAAYGDSFRAALRSAGIDIIQLDAPSGTMNTVRDVTRYARAAVRASKSVDVVHAELGGAALRQLYAALAVQRADRPVFLTVHDPPFLTWWPFHFSMLRKNTYVAGVARRLAVPFAKPLERLIAKRAAGLFVLSDQGTEQLRDFVGPERASRVHRLPYPVRTTTENADVASQDAVLVVGFLGYWFHGKGVEHLVEATHRLRSDGIDVRLRLWGDVSPTAGLDIGRMYRQSILELIAHHDLSGCVSVEGYVGEDELADALRSCDVIGLAYDSLLIVDPPLSSTSAAMFDAFAAGVPVVATDVRAISETLCDGENGLLVPPDDLDALVNALRKLALDPSLRAHLRTGAAATGRRAAAAGVAAVARSAYESAIS